MNTNSCESSMWLAEDVFTKGSNESWKGALEDFTTSIAHVLEVWHEEYPDKVAELLHITLVSSYHSVPGIDDLKELIDAAKTESPPDWGDVLDAVEQIFNDNYECDEDTYYHVSDEDSIYQISWLGGAPLLWTIDSKFVTPARPCSPCVPGGVDLDNPTEDDHGTLAHCPGPDEVNYREMGFRVVYKITGDGDLEEIYRRKELPGDE